MSNKRELKRAIKIHCAHQLIFNLMTSEGLPENESDLQICELEILAIANRICPDWANYKPVSFQETLADITNEVTE